jgi:MFS superfamily sulfate permease-like transporter
MQQTQPAATGVARFIPGLALIKGFSPALLSTEFVVAVTVFAVLVPSSMAYGDLAGVTLVAGLYVALAAIIVSAVFNLEAKGVAVVGAVPAGLPRVTIPAVGVQDVLALSPAALALTILIYADEILLHPCVEINRIKVTP